MKKLNTTKTFSDARKSVLAFSITLLAAFSIVVIAAFASEDRSSTSLDTCNLLTNSSASVSEETKPFYISKPGANLTASKIQHTHDSEGGYAEECWEYGICEFSSDVELLAKVIYLEAGTCSEYCQWLVGSTAMNLAEEYGSLSEVAYNYNIFNVAYLIDSCTPSYLSLSIAERIISGDRDYNVKAFRTSCYHDFGVPYVYEDGVYFSTY